MRESKIEGYLRAEIAKLGGWMEKHVSPGTKGPPDNNVFWSGISNNGVFVSERFDGTYMPLTEFIETKAPDGKLEVLQKRDHKRRRDMGFQVHVIWTMNQADDYLESRGKQPSRKIRPGYNDCMDCDGGNISGHSPRCQR